MLDICPIKEMTVHSNMSAKSELMLQLHCKLSICQVRSARPWPAAGWPNAALRLELKHTPATGAATITQATVYVVGASVGTLAGDNTVGAVVGV